MEDDRFTSEQINVLAGLFKPMHDRLDSSLEKQTVFNESILHALDELRALSATNMNNNTRLEKIMIHHQEECVARTRIEGHITDHKDTIKATVTEVLASIPKKKRAQEVLQIIAVCVSIIIGASTIGTMVSGSIANNNIKIAQLQTEIETIKRGLKDAQ